MRSFAKRGHHSPFPASCVGENSRAYHATSCSHRSTQPCGKTRPHSFSPSASYRVYPLSRQIYHHHVYTGAGLNSDLVCTQALLFLALLFCIHFAKLPAIIRQYITFRRLYLSQSLTRFVLFLPCHFCTHIAQPLFPPLPRIVSRLCNAAPEIHTLSSITLMSVMPRCSTLAVT